MLWSFHVQVVVWTTIVVIIWQVGTLALVWSRIQNQRRLLGRVVRDGIDNFLIRDDLPSTFPWLLWIHKRLTAQTPDGLGLEPQANLNPSQSTSRGSLPKREELLTELDWWLGENSTYVLLQRFSVVGPLVGVVLTAIGFLMIELPQGSRIQMAELLVSVRPVSLSLSAGVGMALANLLFLHLAGVVVDRLRREVRHWLDDHVLPRYGSQNERKPNQEAMDGLKALVGEFALSAKTIQSSTGSLQQSVDAISDQFSMLVQQFDRLPKGFEQLASATAMVTEMTAEMRGAGTRALETLEETAQALQQSVTKQIAGGAGQLHETVEALGQGVNDFVASTRTISDGVKQQFESLHQLNTIVTEEAGPTYKAVRETSTQVAGAASDVTASVRGLNEGMSQIIDQLRESASAMAGVQSQFAQSLDGLRAAVQNHLQPTYEAHQEFTELARDNSKTLQEALDRLQEGGRSLQTVAEYYTNAQSYMEPALATLNDSVHAASQTNQSLQASIDNHFVPTQTLLTQSASTVNASADQLSKFVNNGFVPATQELERLRETTERLNQIMESIRPLTETEELVDALNRVDHALRSLPGELRTGATNQKRSWFNPRR